MIKKSKTFYKERQNTKDLRSKQNKKDYKFGHFHVGRNRASINL